jgi:phenylacetate-coenzyme A ligase PaaK-like adenylate-forming protein
MRASLRLSPERGRRLLGMMPDELLKRMQTARFRSTLRLVAESSTFYRNEFKRRGIEVRRIGHPSELGDFYTTDAAT